MTIIDIIIFVVMGIGVVSGFMKGFLKQLAGLLGLVVGLLAAKALHGTVAEKVFSQVTDSLTLAQALSFILIWIAVPIAFLLVASLLTRFMEVISLDWLNRLLGAGLGAVKYALLLSLLIGVLEFVDENDALIKQTKKDASLFYNPMKDFAGVFFPKAKEVVGEWI